MYWYGYRDVLMLVALVFLLTEYDHVQATNDTHNSNSNRRCPCYITIHSKGYFSAYFGIYENGSTYGILPPLLTANLSDVCCDGQNITFKFVNETSRISVQKLLFEERDKRKTKRIHFYDNDSLEFFFPAYTAHSDSKLVYKEFNFVEVMKSPGPAFIMLIDALKEAPDPSLVLIECWPIFVLLLVMAWVVGIIGWFLDRTKNKEQFPENFYHGSWAGFWWAVVTMTTVGYGDKAPRSFPARLLTILWMITGTIVTSLFTANVTTVLTTKNVAALQNVVGQKVGVLNSKHFFQREINEGASFIEFTNEEEIRKAFYNGEISRVLVPNYLDHLYFTTTKRLKNDFVIARVVKHPFSVGLGLVNDIKNDETMKEFLTCWDRTIINNFEESGLDYSIINPSIYNTAEDARSLINQTSILNMVYGMLVLLFIFFVTGSMWELWKHRTQTGNMQMIPTTELELTKRASPTLKYADYSWNRDNANKHNDSNNAAGEMT